MRKNYNKHKCSSLSPLHKHFNVQTAAAGGASSSSSLTIPRDWVSAKPGKNVSNFELKIIHSCSTGNQSTRKFASLRSFFLIKLSSLFVEINQNSTRFFANNLHVNKKCLHMQLITFDGAVTLRREKKAKLRNSQTGFKAHLLCL